MSSTMATKIRTYSEMIRFDMFEDRFEYLKLEGVVGRSTFGFDREVNQRFYRSREWKSIRDFVIVRDNGCDLGVPGYEIHTNLLIHHVNPISIDDLVGGLHWILDPEYLVTTSHNTHNAIHYGDRSLLPVQYVERRPGDTTLW
jgi:hypothetical protein